MKKKILLLLWICLSWNLVKAEVQLGEFASYLQQFQKASKTYALVNLKQINNELKIKNLKIELGTVNTDSELGVCELNRESPTIIINKNLWESLTQVQKEMLLFHELGHCILGRTHKNTFISADQTTIPASLMSSILISEKSYSNYRDYYLQELFLYGEIDYGPQIGYVKKDGK
jgi:beta-lactamase regulating signal transducer with metallopeptidase domain